MSLYFSGLNKLLTKGELTSKEYQERIIALVK